MKSPLLALKWLWHYQWRLEMTCKIQVIHTRAFQGQNVVTVVRVECTLEMQWPWHAIIFQYFSGQLSTTPSFKCFFESTFEAQLLSDQRTMHLMFIELYHLLLYTHRVQPFSMRLKMTWNVTVRSCIKSIAVEKISHTQKTILYVIIMILVFSFSLFKWFLDLIFNPNTRFLITSLTLSPNTVH